DPRAIGIARRVGGGGPAPPPPPPPPRPPPPPPPRPRPAPAAGRAAGGRRGASVAAGAPVVVEPLNLTFTTPEVNAPASVPFQIEFRNGDAGTPHNVDIKDSSGAEAFKGDIVTGVIVTTYNVPALAPGTYPFVCDVHPNMTGTLK